MYKYHKTISIFDHMFLIFTFQQRSYSINDNVRLSACLSVRQIQGETRFSRPLIEISSNFFVQIPLINEHLFCKYFVRLSVGNATKGFVTYGCFHPCLNNNKYYHKIDNYFLPNVAFCKLKLAKNLSCQISYFHF